MLATLPKRIVSKSGSAYCRLSCAFIVPKSHTIAQKHQALSLCLRGESHILSPFPSTFVSTFLFRRRARPILFLSSTFHVLTTLWTSAGCLPHHGTSSRYGHFCRRAATLHPCIHFTSPLHVNPRPVGMKSSVSNLHLVCEGAGSARVRKIEQE